MLSAACFAAILALGALAVTRKRILVSCGFYIFYAFLTVVGELAVPHIGPVTVYRALYLILFASFVIRVFQDRNFLSQMRLWPLSLYLVLIGIALGSAVYSVSNRPFSVNDNWNIWAHLVVFSLFIFAAGQVHDDWDLQAMAVTSAAVSVVLSGWIIWNAARLNFQAYRGGIEVNQNYVSVFVLAGAIPFVDALLRRRKIRYWILSAFGLLVIVSGALILASRGIFAAFVLAVIVMVTMHLRGKGLRAVLVTVLILGCLVGTVMLLPGGSGFLARFQEERIGSLNERSDIWRHALKYYAESGAVRMVFGQGLASGTVVIRPTFPAYENYHNEYLTWLLDQGLLGLGTLLFFLRSVFKRIASCDHSLKSVMIGWFVFLCTAGMDGTVADIHIFWILLGVSAAASVLRRRPEVASVRFLARPQRPEAGGYSEV